MSAQINTEQIFKQTSPDHILTLDIRTVKDLQIGYQAETIVLLPAEDDNLTIKEYINGLSGTEYYGKVSSNRFKTTVRYGRREEVNPATYVEVLIPGSWHGELQVSSLYGHIISEHDWVLDRFAAEAREGGVFLKTIEAPRIRVNTSLSPVQIERTIGFTDIHTVSGSIYVGCISGGAKFETSDAPMYAMFESLNNIIECTTLKGAIELVLPAGTGMKVDGISKRGTITSEIEGLEIKIKPGNVSCVTGILGQKPYQNVKLSSINGDIILK